MYKINKTDAIIYNIKHVHIIAKTVMSSRSSVVIDTGICTCSCIAFQVSIEYKLAS